MPRRLLPFAAFALSHTALAVALIYAAQRLPPQVASHFNAQGLPDGWMTRAAYLWTMGAIGFGLSVVMLVTFYAMRYFPDATFNLPHREYWLASERRAQTCDAIFHAGLWLVSLLAAFMIGVHLLVVSANNSQPVELPPQTWLLLVCLVATILLWAYAMNRRFRQVS